MAKTVEPHPQLPGTGHTAAAATPAAAVPTEAGVTDLSGHGGGDNPVFDLCLDAAAPKASAPKAKSAPTGRQCDACAITGMRLR